MKFKDTRRRLLACASLAAMLVNTAAPVAFARDHRSGDDDTYTRTPIKHLIVIIGENRSFDHVFATYKPREGQTVSNLLSKGIINADGTPGPNYAMAAQMQASDTTTYSISPTITGPYATLPPVNTGGTPTTATDGSWPPFATLAYAAALDHGLLPRDIKLLTTGASGLPTGTIDTRIANVNALANGPFQITPSLPYDAYASSPVHRFYQMWQQMDCSAAHASAANPSGCLNDLFPWVEVTVGAGTNGKVQPANFNNESTHEGATSMGFYNVQQGDVPYFNQLAHEYALSDNYHQGVIGGTGANHIMLGSADAFWYSDGHGNAAMPPPNQIENPDPQPNTNNWYTQDGYSGGSYSACADTTQPAVGSVVSYLQAMKVNPNCEPGHYYLLNNYNPGYFGDGSVDTTDTYTIPPSSTRTIADVLMEHKISWAYYGEGWNQYVANPHDPNDTYCNICNPFQYETAIMTNAEVRETHLKDAADLYENIEHSSLPAVSIVKPDGYNDGHPTSSKFDIFEGFVKKIVTQLRQHPDLWESTAVLVTVDEGGGYWDSGYIQPVDFFGDGTRIPMLMISPWARGGRVVHDYYDHASIAKFIEANWNLPTITQRSRDNLPNPVARDDNAYVPTNGPAIGDLMGMFNFDRDHSDHGRGDDHRDR